MEVIFIGAGIQVIFSERSEDLVDIFTAFHVVQVDDNVLQINKDTYIEHVGEDVVHEALKSCQCISQTKGHNTPFKGAVVGAECGFPFVTFTDLNEVVGMLQVNFSIHGGFLQAVEKIGDAQKQISVFLGNFVECSKVGAETE